MKFSKFGINGSVQRIVWDPFYGYVWLEKAMKNDNSMAVLHQKNLTLVSGVSRL